MSSEDTLIVNGVKYVREDNSKDGDIKIVVLDRSYVYVGRVSFAGDVLVIKKAKNIRVWGTSKGLGELVNGPTSKTILDDTGTVKVSSRALLFTIDVDQEKWKLS